MLWLKVLALFIAGFSSIAVATAVLLRNPKKLSNISFFALAASMAGWVIAIAFFLLSHHESTAFFWAKTYYFFPLVIAVAIVSFAQSFPEGRLSRLWSGLTLLGFFALAVPLLLVHGFVTEGIAYHDWGKEVTLNRIDYLFYSVYLLLCYPLSLLQMYRISKKGRGLYAAQARLFSVGFFVTVIFGVFFNLILPWAGNYRLIWLGPLFVSSFVIAIAVSIIRHRMFDVRLLVARSITYLATLVVLAAIYGFVVFGIAELAFGLHLSVTTQILLSAATGVAALSFNYLRKLFDRATNALFYRDAYDAQEFFDAFNKALVSTIDLDDLLRRTSQTIAVYLKSQYCVIGVKNGENSQRIIGTEQRNFSQSEIMQARRLTPLIHQTVIVTDDIPTEHERLHYLLSKNNIAVLARITDDVTQTHEGLGYLVLGPKKSGNPYTRQDNRVLEAAANELLIAIQNALRFEAIEQFNITLQQKVDDATRKLQKSNQRLKLLDEAKDDFISMASHQLRTPLTSVKGYISLVLDGDTGPIKPQQRKMLVQAFASSQRMVYLIADLLNVSRLRTGKFLIEPTGVNLADLAQDEVDQLRETAEGRRINLQYDKPAHFPVLQLDETKIRQVVMNFIDNAIYYTPADGQIDIKLSETAKSVELRVTDSGIGVPKAEQHHLFTKFYRAKNAQKARPDGTGLGLFMAQKVVVAQGGAIIFRSREGHGSTFGFTFPKAPTHPEAVKENNR